MKSLSKPEIVRDVATIMFEIQAVTMIGRDNAAFAKHATTFANALIDAIASAAELLSSRTHGGSIKARVAMRELCAIRDRIRDLASSLGFGCTPSLETMASRSIEAFAPLAPHTRDVARLPADTIFPESLYGGIGGPDGGGSPWRACRFTFNTGESWDSWVGECDGTTWNGWDNVRVRPDVHAAITERFGTDEGGTHEIECVDGWHDYSNGFVTSREPENVCRGCEIEIDVGATLCDACKSECGDELIK
jgi:hypothetical protein